MPRSLMSESIWVFSRSLPDSSTQAAERTRVGAFSALSTRALRSDSSRAFAPAWACSSATHHEGSAAAARPRAHRPAKAARAERNCGTDEVRARRMAQRLLLAT